MKQAALVITLGNRELEFDKEKVKAKLGEETFSEMYSKGERPRFLARQGGLILKQNYNKILKYLDLPIVKPALEYYFTNYSDQHNLEKVIIIGTDQSASGKVNSFFLNNDTLYLAELIKRQIPIICSEHNKTSAQKWTTNKIEVFIVQQALSFVDDMYKFWGAHLSKAPFDDLADYDTIVLSNKAGIPALKTTLLLQSLQQFGQKLHLIDVDEASKAAFYIQFPQDYLFDLERERVKTLIKGYNYSPIGSLSLPVIIKQWAGYANARLSFDFDICKNILSNFPSKAFSGRTEQVHWMGEIKELSNGEGLIKELYWNARIKYEQAAYVDFLLRFFRIVEEITKSKALSLLNNFEFIHKTWEADITAFLAEPANQALADFLQNKTVKGNKLRVTSPSIPVFKAIIECYKEEEARLYQFLNQVQSLTELRHLSIGAHAFEPVSKEIIDNTLAKEGTSMEVVFAYLDELLVPFEKNIFKEINDKILSLLTIE